MDFNFPQEKRTWSIVKIVLQVAPWVALAVLLFFFFKKPDLTANDVEREKGKIEIKYDLETIEAMQYAVVMMREERLLLNKQIKAFGYYNTKSKKIYDEKIIDFRNSDDSSRLVKSARTIIEFEFD